MSYKIDEIDYSKNDEIDINNRLSRIGRNNMGENKTPIKDLDDDDKSTAEKNLSIYGAELVNNLKQINYTFRQLEDYVFVPIKENKKGSKKLVEDIRKPPPPPPPPEEAKDYKLEFDFSGVEESKEEEELQETKEGESREASFDWLPADMEIDYLVDVGTLNYSEATQLQTKIYNITTRLIYMIDKLEYELSLSSYDEGPPELEQMRDYKRELDDLSLKLELRRNEASPIPDYVPPTGEGESFETYMKGMKQFIDENLEKKVDDNLAKLEDKFEEAGVDIPEDGLSKSFVEENKDVLDKEGLKILNEVEKVLEELLTNVEKKGNTPTESIFTDPNDPNIDYLKKYTFLDDSKTYTEAQLKNKKKAYEKEQAKIEQLSEEEDKYRKGTYSPAYNALLAYQYKLSTEGPKYGTRKLLEQAESPINEYEGITFPSKKADTGIIRDLIDGGAPIKDIREQFINEGFTGEDINKLKKQEISDILDNYESAITQGSGRYRGGVKRAPKTPTTPKAPKLSKKAQALLTQITPTTPTPPPTTPPPTTPIITIDDNEGGFEDDAVEREQITNFDVAKKLEEITKAIQNTNQKSPLPAYQNKIDELMTGLIQFIGRTTVLFISKLKKNLKYLDEDLTKQIYAELPKFKRNLEILRNYRNKSDKLIKYTLYDQVEKETIGLYNLINDSIRNFSKLKSYTSLEPLQGGYFIQSDNPFIRHSTTKRFL
jgi:hypothetical protein